MAPVLQRIKRIAISYCLAMLVWLTLGVALVWQMHWMYPKAALRNLLILPMVRFFVFALLTPPLFYIVKNFPIVSRAYLRRAAFYIAGSLLFVLCYACLRWLVLPPWDIEHERWIHRSVEGLLGLMQGTFGDQISMYFAIVIAGHAYVFFDRWRKQEIEKTELQQALSESELQLLKMQLHPHFLFNTLHGISALIDSDAPAAKKMIVKLSELLRIALKHGSADIIPLREEMKFVYAYLDLEKMRLGPRIQIDVRIAPETSAMLVPQLILLPLVENAIVHGIACCREGGRLEIVSHTAQGALEICVRNSIGGISQHGTGLGLANTRARLKHLYSDMASFTFAISGKHSAEAALRLPVFGTAAGGQAAGPPASVTGPTLELVRSASHAGAEEAFLP